jgi:HEAT repeat protein
MSRGVCVVCAVALMGALVCIACFYFTPHYPAYQGKSLTTWLDQDAKYLLAEQKSSDRVKRDQAEAAIRHIGTNALPTLLSMVRARDSALKKRLIALVNKQSVIRFHFRRAEYCHAKATYGFGALGPAARPAVPALIRLLHDQDKEVRAAAAQCLSLIGADARDAVPALIRALNEEGNGYGPVLLNSMLALGAIHSEPEVVVPLLVEYLNGSRKDWNYGASAMDALSRYREKAKPAVPAILPFLNDPDESHRSSAEAALCAIDPQAAAQARKR